MKKHLLIVGIIFLFIFSAFAPITFGSNIDSTDDIDPLQDYYGCYSLEEIPESIRPVISEEEEFHVFPEIENAVKIDDFPKQLNSPPMDSPWPMYCHDTRHTGRSPYSTVDTWDEIWRFKQDMEDYVRGGPIIGDDGIIYFGGSCDFYALYPNGTLKWKYDGLDFYVWSTPAIDENGIIYVGDKHGFFYAINPDGTLKWERFFEDDVMSSPAIGDDGTIYFGDAEYYINAVYPNNGSVKWRYKTGLVVYSSPAIGEDGTVYCGSHDTYLYALYPNNGTLKWRYKTGYWIRTSPCIADDGTIYVVSLDNHLHAVNPNGTLKWKTNMGEGGASPTIGQDGIIYCGYTQLHAINPINGTVKWKLNLGSGRTIRGATPCHSTEDIIFFGTHIGDYGGGEIIAVNPDGTERWRNRIANQYVDSAPAISEDGTIYFGSSQTTGSTNYGYLHAFGELDPNAPTAPTITGETSGKPNREYEYTFKSTSPLGNDVYYYIEWGDGSVKDWFGPYSSSEEVKVTHTFSNQGTYTIKARAKDTENLWGPWGELQVNMPRNKNMMSSLFLSFLKQFPILKEVILRLINL